MTEAQKFQKKKNLLIILFMILLVVFVCVMCWIVIYAKNNPPATFLNPEDIEIKQIQSVDYFSSTEQNYILITNSNNFTVTENGENFKLILNNEKEIKLLRNDIEESIDIMQNDKNINNNIKLIYQNGDNNLILTETGDLYKLIDTGIVDGQLKVGKILNNMEVTDLVFFGSVNSNVFALTTNSNKAININTQKEYNGVIQEIQTATSIIYVYENYSFGLEEGKIFVDDYNNIINISMSFDNKIISTDNIVYEINATDNTLLTSSIGEFRNIGYSKDTNSDMYTITMRSTTGIYDFQSSYYYMK